MTNGVFMCLWGCLLLVLSVNVCTIAAEGVKGAPVVASVPMATLPALVDDAQYAEKKVTAQKAPEPKKADLRARFDWLWTNCEACNLARDYASAESYARQMCALAPKVPAFQANLSVFLGKQGRYAEAAEAARKAIALADGNPDNMWHPSLVLASWEWRLGKHEEAQALVDAVPIPKKDASGALSLYYGCLACFSADKGDEAAIEANIRLTLNTAEPDSPLRVFFRRDVVFDPYRSRPWFINLVGKTLAE